MNSLFQKWRELYSSNEGATAIEYGLILALIVTALIPILALDGGLGGTVSSVFQTIADNMPGQAAPEPSP